MMDDDEIRKTIKFLQNKIRRRYEGFSHVDELCDEVPYALALALQITDTSQQGYRTRICQSVFWRIGSYFHNKFYNRDSKHMRPAATVDIDNSTRRGTTIDEYADPSIIEFDAIKKIRLESELAKLTDRERDIIVSKLVNGEALGDVAKRWGITKQMASLIFIATRDLLAKRLRDYEGNTRTRGKCANCGKSCPCDRKNSICVECKRIRIYKSTKTYNDGVRRSRGIEAKVFKKGVGA